MKSYFAFQWHITDTCDQRCKHCYIFAENSCKKLTETPWGKMRQVVSSCEEMCEKIGRTPYFYITGGDPILHKDFWKLAELLKEKNIGICFEIKDGSIEYFNLGVNPIFRETYTIGNGNAEFKGYRITDKCIGCGICQKVCPQNCVDFANGKVSIRQQNCLHCGACFEKCPVKAIERL